MPSTLWVEPGRAVYVGRSLDLAPHSTSVPCVVVGVDDPFRLLVDGQDEVTTRSALVPPRTTHQVVATGTVMFGYVDTTTGGARHQLAEMRARAGAFGLGHPRERELVELCRAEVVDGRALLDRLVPGTGTPPDPRIARAVAYLTDPSREDTSAAAVARHCHLSTSHFLRTFADGAGTTFRRYRLWLRMIRVAAEVSTGSNLTDAAARAGFASPSHFSDTFSTMFGLAPSALIGSGTTLRVV